MSKEKRPVTVHFHLNIEFFWECAARMQGPLAPAVSLPHHIFYFKRRSSSGTYHQSDFSLAATLLLILLLLYWLVLASSPE